MSCRFCQFFSCSNRSRIKTVFSGTKYPLYVQWGLGQVSNNVGIAISLPIAHANSDYKILVTHYNGITPDSVVSLSVGQRKESDFYVSNKTNDNPAFFWVTIGQ